MLMNCFHLKLLSSSNLGYTRSSIAVILKSKNWRNHHSYDFLLKQRREQSESQVLQMFLYALKGLGGKLRGNLAIRKGFGEKSKHKLNDTGSFNAGNASSEFRFFQCLLKILTKVRKDGVLTDRVKKKLCKGHLLNTHAMHFEYLPEVFIRLYQKGFIAADDTSHLQKVLLKYEKDPNVGNKHEVQQCLEILRRYHSGLPLEETSEPYKYTLWGFFLCFSPLKCSWI